MRLCRKEGLPIEKIGQILEFGRYPQGSDGGILPIKWRVLDINNKKALLLSVYGLEVKSYKNRYKKGDWGYTSWSKSGIRRWLNNDFYTQAFSDKETERIIASENDNVIHVEYDRRPRIRTRHAVSTTDNVFLLSVSDVELYLGLKKNTKVEDLNANVELTEMANTLSFSDKDLYYLRLNKYTAVKVPWLLRDSERDLCGFYSAEIVSGNYIGDCSYGSKFAICPAIWVDLSTAEELEQKKKEELEQKKKEEIEKKRLEEEQERKRLEEEEQALKAAEEKRKAEALKAERRRNGVCQYCGGKFKGLFIKKCSVCGNRKNY